MHLQQAKDSREQLTRQVLSRVAAKCMSLKTKMFDLVGDDGKMPPWLRIIYFAQNRFYNGVFESRPGSGAIDAAKFFMPFTDLCDFFAQEEHDGM